MTAGLRVASRLTTRLVDRVALGTGDMELSRRKGLGSGMVDDDLGVRVGRDLRLLLGLTGLKLCPTTRSLVFVLPFHLGLLGGAGCGRVDFRVAGVGVA